MTTELAYRALIVDDDAIARRMLTFSLEREGFMCDTAVDGIHAAGRMATHVYQLVVTDLKMPNKHGHSLAVDLLKEENRPVIVIHTGVEEPKIAKDLLGRGVDDIVYKPTNYSTFAAKAMALVERRFAPTVLAADDRAPNLDAPPEDKPSAKETVAKLDASLHDVGSDLNTRLSGLSKLLPLSQAALDVYTLTTRKDCGAEQVAAAIECDASLTAELLQLGNSSYYNWSGEEFTDLEQIVVRIGNRRVGELALAASAYAAMGTELVPWLDVDLLWRRSISAGVALDLLVEAGGHRELSRGLFLGTIMHPLGRVVLASLYPKEHHLLAEQCRTSGESLDEAERRVFSKSSTEVVAQVLDGWNIHADVVFPLHHIHDPYESLRNLSEPHRTRVELMKLSVLLGRIAVGRWMPWDWLEFPSGLLFQRLHVKDLSAIIEQTRSDMQMIVQSRTQLKTKAATPHPTTQTVAYRTLSDNDKNDLLAMFLPTVGLNLLPDADAKHPDCIVVNCHDAGPEHIKDRRELFEHHEYQKLLIIAPPKVAELLDDLGTVITLPNSYLRFLDMCLGQKEVTV